MPVTLVPDAHTAFPAALQYFSTIMISSRKRYRVRAYSCRIYFTPEGPHNHPTVARAREALEKWVIEKKPSRSTS